MSRNLLFLFKEENCWENKDVINKFAVANRDIPAFTRILVESPSRCFQNRDFFADKLSRNQVEIMVSAADLDKCESLVPCFTPLSNQHFGSVKLKDDSKIALMQKNSVAAEANCAMIVNCLDDWQMQIYTEKHVKKGQVVILQRPESVDDSKVQQHSIFTQLLPISCHQLIPRFRTLMLHEEKDDLVLDCSEEAHKLKIVKKNDAIVQGWIKPKNLKRQSQSWREFVLFYCLRILLNPNANQLDYKFIQNCMVEAYGQHLFENPILLTSLVLEGNFNAQLHPSWYKLFSVKLLMSLSQTKMKLIK